MDELDDDDEENEIKSLLNFLGKYIHKSFFYKTHILYQLEYSNFESDFKILFHIYIIYLDIMYLDI